MQDKSKMILIGPVTNLSVDLIGGATISFGYLADYLRCQKEDFVEVNTQLFPRGILRYYNPINLLIKVLRHGPSSDVIFLNCGKGGTKYVAPVLYLLARLFRMKFVFRPFGGNMKDYTATYGILNRWIFRNTVLKADIIFLQTKELMKYFRKKNANIVQLPTSRKQPLPSLINTQKKFKKRFVFIGFITPSKGIDELIEAKILLGDEYDVHIYGPLKEKYKKIFKLNPGIYKGVLPKEKVLETICKYDVLVLPTFYEGEGYPGSIIEAYSLGLPVISTKWNSIPEIVHHGKTGYLIEPRSTNQLVEAILSFNEKNYTFFSKNAKKYFDENFDTALVSRKALTKIKGLSFNQSKGTDKFIIRNG